MKFILVYCFVATGIINIFKMDMSWNESKEQQNWKTLELF